MAIKDVIIKEGKDPKEYTHLERRKELLDLIMQVGHPKGMNQTKLAKRYGKTQSMISRDIKAIANEIKKNMGSDAELITYAVYHKAIEELTRTDIFKAVQVLEKWNNFLFDSGVKQKAAAEISVKGEIDLSKAYEEYKRKEEEDEQSTDTGESTTE